MARWRQDRETGKLIPIDESAKAQGRIALQGDIEPFVSPVDGTVISDRRHLREHNKRNNVVPTAEFSPEFLERKAKERDDFFNGSRSKEQVHRDRQEIYERITQAERNGR